MKLTQNRLKQIIAEELQRVNEEDEPTAPEPEGGEQQKQTVSKLRVALKQLAADSSKFKGIDSAEATQIADIINRVLAKAQGESAASVFKRLSTALSRLKI